MELLTVSETAAYLKVSTVTVRRYIKARRLPVVRLGRSIRVRKEDVEALHERPEGHELRERYFEPESRLWEIVRKGYRSGLSDVSSDKHKYLADAVDPTG
jgi:excisionase family DNA binding protein